MTRYLDDYLDHIDTDLPNTSRWVRAALNALDAAVVEFEDRLAFSMVLDTFTADENLSERDVVYLTPGNQWHKVETDDTTPNLGRIRGFVVESGGILSGNAGDVRIMGEVRGFSGLTPWAMVYASTTSGGYTQTKPEVSAGGGQVALVPLGIALSATVILANRYPAYYLKRESLDDNDTLVISHHSDPEAQERETRVLINSTTPPASIESYADSNQDADERLKYKTVATYGTDQCSGGTASASDYFGSQFASLAFDDDTGTYWGVITTSAWVEYQFASAKTIRRYSVRTYDGSDAPRDWTFQYYNGSTWVTVDTVSSETGWGLSEQRAYDVDSANSATRWRINITASNGSSLAIREMEMLEAATFNDLNEKAAQSFQIDSVDDISQVKLWLKKTGSPTGNLTVTIEADDGGEPSGTPVTNGTSDTVAASGLSTSYGWIEFDFSSAPSLAAGTTYWLVLQSTGDYGTDDYVLWGIDSSSPSYPNGQIKIIQGGVWIPSPYDACFDIYNTTKYYNEPAAIGRWNGETGDFAVRIGDASGTNPNTRTAFKNLSGDTLDVTCMVVME